MSDQIEIVGTAQVEGLKTDVALCGGMMYLLTRCCGASGKGSSVAEDDHEVVCRGCYQTVDPAFGDGAIVTEIDEYLLFIERHHVNLKENVMTETNETTEPVVETDPLASPKTLQAEVAKLRKEMGLSRRALADSIGWTESRVWYLEQEGVRLDVQRNAEDLGTLQQHMEELKAAGWVKPTVKTAARAAAPKKDEGWFTKDQLDEALASQVKIVAELRQTHADELTTLRSLVQAKIDEAKAKKAGTAALMQVLGTINDMVWES